MQAKPFPAVTALPARSGFTELIKWEQKKEGGRVEGGWAGVGEGEGRHVTHRIYVGAPKRILARRSLLRQFAIARLAIRFCRMRDGREQFNNQDLQRNFGEMPWCGQTTVLLLLLLLKICVVVHCATALCAVVPWLHVQSNSVAELMLQPVQTRCGGCC